MFSAALLLLLALEPQPGASGHAQKGYALAQRGETQAAEAELREAVRLAPKDPFALSVLGVVLSRPGKLDEANTYLERALKLDPNDATTRYNLALNQVRLGQVAPAKANLELILKQKPDHQAAVDLLARIQEKSAYETALSEYGAGRFAQSQALLERMAAAGSKDARAFSLLAWCYQRQNRGNDALAIMRRAIEWEPKNSLLYSNAAQMLLEDGESKAAYASVMRALDLAPDNVAALKLKGLMEIQHGDLKRALASYQRAVALNPSDPEALAQVGTAQRTLFQYREATATFEQGLARFPRYAPMYAAYGKLLLDPGTRPNAAAESRGAVLLQKALSLDPTLAEPHYELGKLLLGDGKVSEAVGHLETASKLEPQNGAAHLALATAYRLLARSVDQARELQLYRNLQAAKTQTK